MTETKLADNDRIEVRSTELFVLEGRLRHLQEGGFKATIPVQDGSDWVSWVTPPKRVAID